MFIPLGANPVFIPFAANPVFIPFAANPVFIPLSANSVFIPLGANPAIYPACRRAQCLSRLAANLVFIPLDGDPSIYPACRRAQCLSRLAANPVFIPLGALSNPESCTEKSLPRLRGKVAAGRKGGIKAQCLSRLAGIRHLPSRIKKDGGCRLPYFPTIQASSIGPWLSQWPSCGWCRWPSTR